MSTPSKIFTIWCNNKPFYFAADQLAEVSTKCRESIAQNLYFGVIEARIPRDTFESFSDACQQRPYKSTRSNAHGLLKLAVDWGIKSLEDAMTEFISAENVPPPEESDPLADLIQHTEKGQDDPNGILAVATIVNEALKDERLSSLPFEIIFRIVVAADPASVDQNLLIEFVMSLFETNPAAAGPLVLLLDFEKLTPEQRGLIFQCPQMHEQNVGFFVTQLMSNDRNKAERELAQAEGRLLSDLFSLRNNIEQHEQDILAQLKDNNDHVLDEIRSQLNDHQAKIDELNQNADSQTQAIGEAVKSHATQFAAMKAQLDQLEKISTEKSSEAEGQTSRISSEVSDQVAKLRDELERAVEKVGVQAGEKTAAVGQGLKEKLDEQKARLKDARQRTVALAEELKAISEGVTELKSVLAAKILKDRLRFDQFLRQTDRRFDVFTRDQTIWDLTADSVRESEAFVTDIEERLESLCPIRGNQSPTK
jgi:hypothetical protein